MTNVMVHYEQGSAGLKRDEFPKRQFLMRDSVLHRAQNIQRSLSRGLTPGSVKDKRFEAQEGATLFFLST